MTVLVVAPLVIALMGLLVWALCVAAKDGDAQEIVDEEPPMLPEPPMDYKLRGPRR